MMRQTNPSITLVIGILLVAVGVVFIQAATPRYLVLIVGVGLILFGLLRILQQRRR